MRGLALVIVISGFLPALLQSASAGSLADASVPYSAELTVSGREITQALVHYTPGTKYCSKAYRYDINVDVSNTSPESRHVIHVAREEPDPSWVAFPSGQTYALIDQPWVNLPIFDEENLELRLEGPEAIAGISTSRFSFSSSGRATGEAHGRIWLTEDNVPVRVIATIQHGETTQDFRWELIEVGEVSCSKFDVPDGYRQIRWNSPVKPE